MPPFVFLCSSRRHILPSSSYSVIRKTPDTKPNHPNRNMSRRSSVVGSPTIDHSDTIGSTESSDNIVQHLFERLSLQPGNPAANGPSQLGASSCTVASHAARDAKNRRYAAYEKCTIIRIVEGLVLERESKAQDGRKCDACSFGMKCLVSSDTHATPHHSFKHRGAHSIKKYAKNEQHYTQ